MRRIGVLLISTALITAGCARTTVSSGRTDEGGGNSPVPGGRGPGSLSSPAAGGEPGTGASAEAGPSKSMPGIAEQILGTWEGVKPANAKDKPTRVWVFTRDRVTWKTGSGEGAVLTFPYRIERNYLILIAPSGGSDGTFRIKSISDKKMVLYFIGKPAKLPENESPPQADKLDQEFVKR